MKELYFSGITWLTTDVNRFLSCMSITHLDLLGLDETCQLRSSLSPASPSSPVKVDRVQIAPSLSINTLTSLISHLEVNTLAFWSGCQVLDMDVKTTPPHQVSQGHQCSVSDNMLSFSCQYIWNDKYILLYLSYFFSVCIISLCYVTLLKKSNIYIGLWM